VAILRSVQPDPVVPDVSITDYVLRRVADRGDAAAFIDGSSGRVLTYASLADRIRRLAGGLQARGIGPGTTWALMAPNDLEYPVAFHGLAYAGATITTLNPAWTAKEVSFQLADSQATAIVTVAALLPVVAEAAALAGIDSIVLLDAVSEPAPGLTPLADWFGDPLAEQVPLNYREHIVALPYSSGTTGFPKGVMLTHRNLVANLEQFSGHQPLNEDDVCFAVLPFFHIYGLQILMNATLSRGCCTVVVPRFDLLQMLELTQTQRMTRLFLVPPIVLALAKHPIIDKYDLSSVVQIFSGAAPLGAEVADAAAARLGCSIGQGYGMTELSPVVLTTPGTEVRPGSVGTLAAGTEARLVDPETGEDVPTGGRGELWFRGEQVMTGYLGNALATSQTITPDGWLKTGDIGVFDEDGHCWIVDRLKELIKYKGFQVAPAELEALLLTHPSITDAAVIGIADDEAGELPKAFVVLRPDSDATADAIRVFVKERVATYKQVRIVELVDSIPKSASGKILRRELREREAKS